MTVLKDTSLCAIVRDEKMNPAGGVERFLRCHLPYVEEAVVLDTGSIDGTREILDQMAKEFAHLKVYDGIFKGYARTRNMSLKKVKTKWALVLDADELIEPASFDIIAAQKKLDGKQAIGYNFEIRNLHSDDVDIPRGSSRGGIHNPRLFNNQKGFIYRNSNGLITEWLYSDNYFVCDSVLAKRIPSVAHIIHFLPSLVARHIKDKCWYDGLIAKGVKGIGSPSQIDNFAEWKKLNPHRANYPG